MSGTRHEAVRTASLAKGGVEWLPTTRRNAVDGQGTARAVFDRIDRDSRGVIFDAAIERKHLVPGHSARPRATHSSKSAGSPRSAMVPFTCGRTADDFASRIGDGAAGQRFGGEPQS
jgi:hypothetical protein